MKAFKVICKRFYPGEVAYFSGKTASKARYAALTAIKEMYPSATFADIRVLRAPKFDPVAALRDRAEGITGHIKFLHILNGEGSTQ